MTSMLPPANGAQDLIVYIHGFDITGNGYEMPQLVRYINENVPGAAHCATWSPIYNSRDHSFLEATRLLMAVSQTLPTYRRRFAVCHSMGGVVARQLNLFGANFETIVTLNTPHQGTAFWTSALTIATVRGGQSLLPNSSDLHALNRDDGHLRGRLHCVGVFYRGFVQTWPIPSIPWSTDHDDDTLIQRASQMADGLENVASRHWTRMDYGLAAPVQSIGWDSTHSPHAALVEFPWGNHPHVRFDTAPMLAALRTALRLA